MKRKLLTTIIAGVITCTIAGTTFAADFDTTQCEHKQLKVTAYYSPLKGQDFYYRGNYSDEVTLNGNGTHGASGRAVFNGMIAAPSSYAFGTELYFPGRGIGKVEDRGGAIVEQGERTEASLDRIDIWAGKGEDGLERALSFGVQYLDAYICPDGVIGSDVGFDYDKFPIFEDFFHKSLWVMQLRPQREDPWVGALQDYLIAMGYMKEGRSTMFYGDETTDAVCDFQHDQLGIAKSSERCGLFGPQTRYALEMYAKKKGLVDENRNPLLKHDGGVATINQESNGEVKVEVPTTLDERIIDHLFTNGEFKYYEFMHPFVKGESSKEIRILQRKLQRLGFIDKSAKISGIYDRKTIEAVFAFQLDKGILSDRTDISIQGYFGEKTREMMNNL